MRVACELHGFLRDGGPPKALSVWISSPITEDIDHFCVVHASPILDRDRKIYGIDEAQAFSLAKGFACALLENLDVVDDRNLPLNLDVLKRR
jgi:hypothetical protein